MGAEFLLAAGAAANKPLRHIFALWVTSTGAFNMPLFEARYFNGAGASLVFSGKNSAKKEKKYLLFF